MDNSNLKEVERRKDLVIGIILSSIVAFIINIFSNTFCSIFIFKDPLADINGRMLAFVFIVFTVVIGFLFFLIDDYKNATNFDKALFLRFINYFFHKYKPGVYIRRAIGGYLLIATIFALTLSLSLLFSILLRLDEGWGTFFLSLAVVCIFFIAILKKNKQL